MMMSRRRKKFFAFSGLVKKSARLSCELTNGTRHAKTMVLDKQLNDAFKLTLKPAAFFLGNNVTVHDGAQGGAP